MTPGGSTAPFAPPYRLDARVGVIAGLWETGSLPALAREVGSTPVSIFERPLGLVMLVDYERVPEELAVTYREVIAAVIVRQGWRHYLWPFDMVLDHSLPVDLGQRYYSLPKRLDPSLRVAWQTGARAASNDVEVVAAVSGIAHQLFGYPARLGGTLATLLGSRWLFALGTERRPFRTAQVALTPRQVGQWCRTDVVQIRGRSLRPLWSQRFERVEVRLGAPHPVADAATDRER